MNQWRIGDVRISRIVELEVTGGSLFILPDATREAARPIEWLAPHFMDEYGNLTMSIHSLVVETGDRRILVDTCLGNDKKRDIPNWNMRQGPFLEDLADAGFPRESIDQVLCTHLHVDHVGWNTMWSGDRWIPTFPNARYLMGREEWEHWDRAADEGQDREVIDDSVRPVVEADLVDLVEMDAALSDEVSLVPTPGHTPGHVSVRIRSKGEEALITGDFLHHPCQIAKPHWCSPADSDSQAALATRRRMFEELADSPVLVIGTHFATPSAGRLVRDGDAYRLDVDSTSSPTASFR